MNTESAIADVLLPLALDVFLWLGPHLSIKPLVDRFLAAVRELFGLADAGSESAEESP